MGPINNNQKFQQQKPTYKKSWAFITVVALTAIAAGGLLVGSSLHLVHMPSFFQNRQFKLGVEIGSPLGALTSIATSILLTKKKQDEIRRQQYMQGALKTAEANKEREQNLRSYHARTRLETREVENSKVNLSKSVKDVKLNDLKKAQKEVLNKPNDLIVAHYRKLAEIYCLHYITEDNKIQFSKTQDAQYYASSFTLNQDSLTLVSEVKDQSEIASVISSTYKILSQPSFFSWGSPSSETKQKWMAQAIATAVQTFGKKPYFISLSFEGRLFISTQGFTAALMKEGAGFDELKEHKAYSLDLEEGAIYQMEKPEEGFYLVVGNLALYKGLDDNLANLHPVLQKAESHEKLAEALLNGALFQQDKNNKTEPTACLVQAL